MKTYIIEYNSSEKLVIQKIESNLDVMNLKEYFRLQKVIYITNVFEVVNND